MASRCTGPRVPVVGRRSALAGHAPASIDGHVPKPPVGWPPSGPGVRRPRVTSGLLEPASPVLSSGFCPRHAEWGSNSRARSTARRILILARPWGRRACVNVNPELRSKGQGEPKLCRELLHASPELQDFLL